MRRKSISFRHLIVALVIVAATLFLDQLSKALIHERLPLWNEPIIIIPGLISFTHVHNTGAAFSLGANSSTALTIFMVLTAVCLVAVGWALYRYGKRSKLLLAALSLIFSGAAGNLIDRLRFRYVDDFIKFEFWERFAVFNVADICVCVGAALFVIYFAFVDGSDVRRERREKKRAMKDDPSATNGGDGSHG